MSLRALLGEATVSTLREALREGARLLAAAGSDEAALEAHLLLRHTLGLDRVRLYQRLTQPITQDEQRAYRRLLDRRLSREPVPYITGRREFFGLQFEVSPAAIIPRPETEALVELAIVFARDRYSGSPFTVTDIGTGCGAIAVTLARQLSPARIVAIDTSAGALALAQRNARRHGVDPQISFVQGDLLRPLRQPVDIVVANLPYVRTADWERLPPEIREHEPRSGLDGGPDGLRVIERLLWQACLPAGRRPARLRPGGALFAEIGESQGSAALRLARRAFPQAQIEVKPDLAGLDRVLAVYA